MKLFKIYNNKNLNKNKKLNKNKLKNKLKIKKRILRNNSDILYLNILEL